MPNEANASSKPEPLRQTEKPKPYVLLALIEHGSRPAVFLIVGLFALFVLFQFKEPLFGLIKTTEALKIGSFEMRVRVSAEAA